MRDYNREDYETKLDNFVYDYSLNNAIGRLIGINFVIIITSVALFFLHSMMSGNSLMIKLFPYILVSVIVMMVYGEANGIVLCLRNAKYNKLIKEQKEIDYDSLNNSYKFIKNVGKVLTCLYGIVLILIGILIIFCL